MAVWAVSQPSNGELCADFPGIYQKLNSCVFRAFHLARGALCTLSTLHQTVKPLRTKSGVHRQKRVYFNIHWPTNWLYKKPSSSLSMVKLAISVSQAPQPRWFVHLQRSTTFMHRAIVFACPSSPDSSCFLASSCTAYYVCLKKRSTTSLIPVIWLWVKHMYPKWNPGKWYNLRSPGG